MPNMVGKGEAEIIRIFFIYQRLTSFGTVMILSPREECNCIQQKIHVKSTKKWAKLLVPL